jgi:hypothetical protein
VVEVLPLFRCKDATVRGCNYVRGKLKQVYKTFIVASAGRSSAQLLGYLTGTLTAVQAAQVILPAVIGSTLRDALNSAVGRAVERAIVELLEVSVQPPIVAAPPIATVQVAPVPVQPTATPLTDTAKQIAPVAVDVIAAVKAIIAASEGKPHTIG